VEARTLTTLRAGVSIRAGGLTIVPVERSRVTVACVPEGVRAWGAKEGAAVVLVTSSGERALGPSGEAVGVAELLASAKGLREALERSRRPAGGTVA